MNLFYGLVCSNKCKSEYYLEIDGKKRFNLKCMFCRAEYHFDHCRTLKSKEISKKVYNFIYDLSN